MRRRFLCAVIVSALLASILCGCSKEPVNDGIMNVLGKAQPTSAVAEAEPPPEVQASPAPEAEADGESQAGSEPSLWETYDPDMDMTTVMRHLKVSQLPLTEASVSFTVWGSDILQTGAAAKQMQEVTNVAAEYIPTASLQSEFQLMMASGEFYDILYGIQSIMDDDALIDSGAVTDITDMLETCCPSFSGLLAADGLLKSDITTDTGRIAGLAEYTYGNLTYQGSALRYDWIDILDLPAPTTLGDYHDYFSAVKAAGLSDKPVVLDYAGLLGDSLLLTAFGGYVGDDMLSCFRYDVDDQLVFGFTDDSYRQYLHTMTEWYGEGLVNIEREFSSTIDEITALQPALFQSDLQQLEALKSAGLQADSCYEPVMTDGQTVCHKKLPEYEAGVFVSSSCQSPELALNWLDWHFSLQGSQLCIFGVAGVSMSYDMYAIPHYSDLILNNPDGLSPGEARKIYAMPGAVCSHDMGADYNLYTEAQSAAVFRWGYTRQVSKSSFISRVRLSEADRNTAEALFSDIYTYVRSTAWQFIIGQRSIDEDWQDFADGVNNAGGDRLYSIVSAACEDYFG